MRIFVERHLLDISHALATSTQNFSRIVVTERRREISRRGREIFVVSERTPKHFHVCILRHPNDHSCVFMLAQVPGL